MNNPATQGESSHCPLVVDLDGTLIRSDLLWESLAAILGRRPWLLFVMPFWLLAGRARLKARVAQHHCPNPGALPYRPEVLALCRAAHSSGRRLILASASPAAWVQPIAAHLGFFDAVLATESDRNLTGSEKLAAIREEIGDVDFAYLGNSRVDAPIWAAAREALGVGMSPSAARVLAGHSHPTVLESDAPSSASAWLGALRPRQWAKNVLVFAPLVLAHDLADSQKLASVVLCFALFCAVASAGYLLNDLLDLQSDRLHPAKRARPIASGELSIPRAIVLLVGLLGTTLLAGSLWARPEVALMLGAYAAISFAYSIALKRTLLLDVLVLAGLYTHRILTGGVAADVSVSPWLLAFSAFFFLSLALVKRYLELVQTRERALEPNSRRAYELGDIPMIEAVGITCGLISVLVLCLYISSSDVSRLYNSPQLLWLICPVMFYWITRIWFLARRGELDEDPVLFATRDPRSYLVAVLSLAIVGAAATW